MSNALKNPGFEGDWWRKTYTGQQFGEIFVPEHWVAFWKEGGPVPHDPSNHDGYGRPEMQVINREPPFLDPPRVRSGDRALKFFTFFRIHDAGVYQQVQGISPGARLRGTGWAHAWSSSQDDPKVSDGPGRGAYSVRASEYDRDDGVRNFTFTVGIDPTGGTDPWADSVVWGEGAHIYNAYAQIPPVEAVAQASTVTFFVRSKVLWPFKHCDAYLDDMQLTVIEEVPLKLSLEPEKPVEGEPFELTAQGGPGPENLSLIFEGGEVFQRRVSRAGDRARWRCVAVEPGAHTAVVSAAGSTLERLSFSVARRTGGQDFIPPREDYARTYLLLPPGTGSDWVRAVLESGLWDAHHWTMGTSADDAGIGPRRRKVIAVNPQAWPTDLKLFFEKAYPGVEYKAIVADTPEMLEYRLKNMLA
jgi:hypothetical protein